MCAEVTAVSGFRDRPLAAVRVYMICTVNNTTGE